MSKGNTFESDLLALIFNGTAIADLAENDSSSPLASLYVSLHTNDPGDAGSQTSNEATYTNYARVAVTRDNTGWTVSGGTVENAAAITFPQCGGGSESVTHFAIGTASSGAGKILYSGALAAPLAVSAGITPEFAAGALTVTED